MRSERKLQQPTVCWRQQGWHAQNDEQTAFMNAAHQCEQEPHDRTEVAEATAQTPAEMLHEFFQD